MVPSPLASGSQAGSEDELIVMDEVDDAFGERSHLPLDYDSLKRSSQIPILTRPTRKVMMIH